MNKARVRKVALALLTGSLAEAKGIGYNQRPFFSEGGFHGYPDNGGHSCGTVACIGGHAAYFAGGKRSAKGGNVWKTAKRYFGISDETAYQLFAAVTSIREPTAKQAAIVLFAFAETGEVNWNLAL